MGNRYTCKQTFEEWCLENNRQDILDLWDYELNTIKPSEIPFGTKRRYYFKCPNGMHQSADRRIQEITGKPNCKIICKECSHHNDLTGQLFGELVVLEYDKEKTNGSNHRWICQCSCGNVVSVLEAKLKTGNKLTCGGKYRHKANKKLDGDGITDVFDSTYIKELRRSNEYYAYRQAVQQKDGYKCIICGSHNIEVHHIYPFATHPHDRLNPDTGICICKEHHSTSSPISFHSIYGRYDNTPEQLEEYVNRMRQALGNDEPFDVYDYMNNIESDNMDIDDSMLDLYE